MTNARPSGIEASSLGPEARPGAAKENDMKAISFNGGVRTAGAKDVEVPAGPGRNAARTARRPKGAV